MDYDHESLVYSPPHLAFGSYNNINSDAPQDSPPYNAYTRHLDRQEQATRQQSEEDSGPLFSRHHQGKSGVVYNDQSRQREEQSQRIDSGIQLCGRAKEDEESRREGKKRRKRGQKKSQRKRIQSLNHHQQQQQQQQHLNDQSSAHFGSNSRQPSLVGDGTLNANTIEISESNNRLRDRFITPQLRSTSVTKEEDQHIEVGLSLALGRSKLQASDKQRQKQRLSLQSLQQHMAASNGAPPTPTGPAATHGNAPVRSRRLPNHVQIADAYIFQQTIDERLNKIGVTPAREDALRLAGVQWIDQVRKAMRLPVRTFDTACVYYHKFRLMHGDNEYAFVDAAAAALFAACKIEDTLKKSRDILCAAHNLKAPSRAEQLSPDDPHFEASSRTIVGHERLMLEASGFDFRSRHPQVLLMKLSKAFGLDKGSETLKTAYKISIDLYRTMAPLKQSTPVMAFSCLELAERLQDSWTSKKQDDVERRYKRWGMRREMVVETLLDLLDLYTSYRTSTTLGPTLPLDAFINVRIPLNDESASRKLPRYTEYIERKQPKGPANDGGYGKNPNGLANGGSSGRSSKNTSPKDGSPGGMSVPGTGGSASTVATAVSGGAQGTAIRQRASERGREGTVRFMINPEREREERAIVAEYERGGR